jgi:chemotaxis protein MotB
MSRRHRHEEHQNHEAWAIPYGDLITLLLAFFVVMYAMSSVNEGKYRVLSDSLVAAFRGQPMTMRPVQVGQKQVGSGADLSMSLVQQDILSGQPRDLFAPLPLKPIEVVEGPGDERRQPLAESDETAEGRGNLDAVEDEVGRAMIELVEQGLVSVRRRQATVEIEIRTDILFDSGSATLTRDAEFVIKRIAAVLSRFDNAILVEGHTDDRPIRTALFPSNWELSAARAASVVHVLTQSGVPGRQVTVVGFAEFRPVSSNGSAEGRNANRRVLVVVRGTVEKASPAANATLPPE